MFHFQVEQDCMLFVIPDEVMLRILCNLSPLDLLHVASASIVTREKSHSVQKFLNRDCVSLLAIILSCGRAHFVEISLRSTESEDEHLVSDRERRELEEVLLLIK